MPTTGVLVVEAMCRGPLSPPMKRALRSINARNSTRSTSPNSSTWSPRPGPNSRRAARPIRSAAARSEGPELEDDAPAFVIERQRADERGEGRLGPSPKRVAGAHVNHDDLMPCSAPAARRRGKPRIGLSVEHHFCRMERRVGFGARPLGERRQKRPLILTECQLQLPRPVHGSRYCSSSSMS